MCKRTEDRKSSSLLFQCLSLNLWNLDVAIALSVTRGITQKDSEVEGQKQNFVKE